MTAPVIFAIDPSSTATGWALMRDANLITRSGVIRPVKSWNAERRIDWMCEDISALLIGSDFADITHCVIEVSSGHQARRYGKMAMSGLSIYGQAIGEIRRECIHQLGRDRVHTVAENVWTLSRPKRDRAKLIEYIFPTQYDPANDKGMDEADAIGLGLWFREHLQTRGTDT